MSYAIENVKRMYGTPTDIDLVWRVRNALAHHRRPTARQEELTVMHYRAGEFVHPVDCPECSGEGFVLVEFCGPELLSGAAPMAEFAECDRCRGRGMLSRGDL